jgi:hypothetical protein
LRSEAAFAAFVAACLAACVAACAARADVPLAARFSTESSIVDVEVEACMLHPRVTIAGASRDVDAVLEHDDGTPSLCAEPTASDAVRVRVRLANGEVTLRIDPPANADDKTLAELREALRTFGRELRARLHGAEPATPAPPPPAQTPTQTPTVTARASFAPLASSRAELPPPAADSSAEERRKARGLRGGGVALTIVGGIGMMAGISFALAGAMSPNPYGGPSGSLVAGAVSTVGGALLTGLGIAMIVLGAKPDSSHRASTSLTLAPTGVVLRGAF